MTALSEYFHNLLTVLLEFIDLTMPFLAYFHQQKANYVTKTVKSNIFVEGQKYSSEIYPFQKSDVGIYHVFKALIE